MKRLSTITLWKRPLRSALVKARMRPCPPYLGDGMIWMADSLAIEVGRRPSPPTMAMRVVVDGRAQAHDRPRRTGKIYIGLVALSIAALHATGRPLEPV